MKKWVGDETLLKQASDASKRPLLYSSTRDASSVVIEQCDIIWLPNYSDTDVLDNI